MFTQHIAPLHGITMTHALAWAARQGEVYAAIDNHGEPYPGGTFPQLVAVGARRWHQASLGEGKVFCPEAGSFWIGYLAYDYGLELAGQSIPGIRFDDGTAFAFFEPIHLITWGADGGCTLYSPEPERLIDELNAIAEEGHLSAAFPLQTSLLQQTEWPTYAANLAQIRHHLHEGNVYEVNYCRSELYKSSRPLDWPAIYESLTAASPMPFQYLFSGPGMQMAGSSPERFLRWDTTSGRLTSQPIKGTVRRHADPAQDTAARQALRTDEKTLAENMMITDMVRNDLVQACTPGTVEVAELFGLYTFRALHQMITTVTGAAMPGLTWDQLLRATFPMGSMTGAPKPSAMRLISELEGQARGPFSGAIGYIQPNGTADLAVIIRGLYHNPATSDTWLSTGGAIVWDSDPAQEWEECLLKGQLVRALLTEGY